MDSKKWHYAAMLHLAGLPLLSRVYCVGLLGYYSLVACYLGRGRRIEGYRSTRDSSNYQPRDGAGINWTPEVMGPNSVNSQMW